MMDKVRSMNDRARCLGVAILAAAWLPGLPTQAGEASASFRITVQVLPEAAGSCSASTGSGPAQLTCRPGIVGTSSTTGGDPRQPPGALYFGRETPLRVAGEMVEVGAENYYAWLENNPTAWSERSTRRIVAGGREYLETTFSW